MIKMTVRDAAGKGDTMGTLVGLQEYLDEKYQLSVFDRALEGQGVWELHLHGRRVVRARFEENLVYDVKCDIEGEGAKVFQKTDIKLLYPADLSDRVRPLVKTDKKIAGLGLEPIIPAGKRYHIKNKSLFPLMKEKTVLFFVLLEGELIRGIIGDFSRYEIDVRLKGGVPVTILRHGIYDLHDKRGRCYLKSRQEELRDWEKSPLYADSLPAPDSDHSEKGG
jgi:hypothetical protein